MEKLGMEFERDVVTTTGWPYRLYRMTLRAVGVGAVSGLRRSGNIRITDPHDYLGRADFKNGRPPAIYTDVS
jgi:hypothetical protein